MEWSRNMFELTYLKHQLEDYLSDGSDWKELPLEDQRLKSMPPVQRGLDALWHCLQPAFTDIIRGSPRQISKPWRRFMAHPDTTLPSYNIVRKTVCQQDPTANPPLPPLPQYISTHQLRPFRRIRSGPHGVLRGQKLQKLRDTPQGYVSSDLGNEAIYTELQYESLRGNYERVQALVETLVEVRGEEPSSRLYLALILANTNPHHGSPAEVKRILNEMAAEGLVPESAIYHAALKVLAIHPDYVLRNDILEELRQRWFTITSDGWHNIIAGMIRDRQLELALDVVELLQEEGTRIHPWLYDLIVYNLCDAEEFDEVLKIMRHRTTNGELLISATLWFYFLDTASRALHHEATLYVWHKRVETSYLNPPSGTCINILNTAARHGDFRLATDVFRILGNRSQTLHLYHYESLLESYLASSDLKAALTLLTVMTSSGVPPTDASTRPIFLHLRQSPSLPANAHSILRHLSDTDRPIPAPAINVIIESHIHHHDLASAIETYKTLHELCPAGPTTATFNALFRGCAKAVRKDLAMFLAAEMLALNVPPDALTYDRLMLVCLNANEEEEEGFVDAWRYFEEMRGVGWWPRAGTMVALAKRCCERGDERVWRLVGEVEGQGLTVRKMETLVKDHWRGGEREV